MPIIPINENEAGLILMNLYWMTDFDNENQKESKATRDALTKKIFAVFGENWEVIPGLPAKQLITMSAHEQFVFHAEA